jgi:hypothetical protein
MNIEIPIPHQLFTAFNDVTFFDEPHKYYWEVKELISATTIIHRYKEEFNEDYWSQSKSDQFRVSQRDILRAWNFINKKGTIKGSSIHDYAENLFQNKKFEYPKQTILNEFGFDPIKKEYDITRKHVDKFYGDVQGKLIPIKTELVVYDKETLIGGMLDILFYNVRAQEFQIWDYKTNKKLSLKTERRLANELFVLDDSDLSIYSLQLGLYKYIIEKNTGIKLGKSYLVWFSHNNENYEIIETKDYSYFVDILIKNRLNEIKGIK